MQGNILLFVFYCLLIMIAIIIAVSKQTPIEKLNIGFNKLSRATRNTAASAKKLSKTLKTLAHE